MSMMAWSHVVLCMSFNLRQGWAVNRYVLHELMGWEVFLSPPSLLVQNALDFSISTQDLSAMQTTDWPCLLTNAAVPGSNSWSPYIKSIHFDKSTGLALMNFYDQGDPFMYSQVDAAKGALRYIAHLNGQRAACRKQGAGATATDAYFRLFHGENATMVFEDSSEDDPCWIPIAYYSDVEENYHDFVEALMDYEYAPALIIDRDGHAYDEEEDTPPLQVGSKGMWLSSFPLEDDTYMDHKITKSADGMSISKVERIVQDLGDLSAIDVANDAIYVENIAKLRMLADEAHQNDPVVGQIDAEMPVQRVGSDYFRCKAGECEMGNLFTDAVRWYKDADFAFFSTGGLRGGGWSVGDVKTSFIWEASPFPNAVCSGTMSGLSVFQLFNFSIGTATFEAAGTENGSRLLQVYGAKIVYNTQLPGGDRLVSIDMFDKVQKKYLPLDRLRMYTFATDSYLCGGQKDFSQLTGPNFVVDGEVPGTIDNTALQQEVVARYLSQLSGPYHPSLEGRLFNDTDASVALNLIQTEDSCKSGSYWAPEELSCLTCPLATNLGFSDKTLSFEMQAGVEESNSLDGRIVLVNREVFSVKVTAKSVPSWVVVEVDETSTGAEKRRLFDNDGFMDVVSGESVAFKVSVTNPDTEHTSSVVSNSVGTVSFGVLGGLNYPGCVSQNAAFDVTLRVTPEESLNQLGSVRIAGFVFMGIAVFTAAYFAGWVHRHRKSFVVNLMQPNFLITLCCGILIIALTILPMSFDDGSASIHGNDIACMATPWLLVMGLTVSFSALIAKLWRVNRVFGSAPHRRTTVKERDVLAPFVVLFTLNFGLLLTWTLADPLQWERRSLNGDDWNTYGTCTSGTLGKVMLGLTCAVNVGALLFLCYQAWRARSVHEALSESKYLGIAIFSWLEVALVGLPVLFLLGDANPSAKYFLWVAFIFVLCMSMLLLIFIPLHGQLNDEVRSGKRRSSAEILAVTRSSILSSPMNRSRDEIKSSEFLSGRTNSSQRSAEQLSELHKKSDDPPECAPTASTRSCFDEECARKDEPASNLEESNNL